MPAFASPPPYRPTRQTWRNAFYYQPVDGLPAHGSSAAYISAMQASNAADPNIRMVPFGQDNWNAGSESYYFVDSWPSGRPVSRANWSIINTAGSTANPHLYWPDLRQQNAVRNSPWAQALFGLPDYAVNLSNGDRHAILWSESTGELVEAIGYSGLGAAAEAIVTWDLDSYVLPRNGSTPVGAVAACFPVAPLMFTYQDLLDCGASGDLGHMLGLSVFNYGTTFGWPARKSDGTLAGGVPGGTVFRLKSNFNLNSLPNNALKAVARTLQRFGAVIYDRNFTRHQILTPNDPAWPQGQSDLGVLLGSLLPWSAFEAVDLSSVAGVTDSIAVSGSTPAVQGVTLDGDPESTGVSLNVSARLTVSSTAAEPVARFTATPTTGMVPLTVTFDGGSSQAADGGPVTEWSWDFGDGTTGSGRVVTHTYLTPGEYTPELTVTAGTAIGGIGRYDAYIYDPYDGTGYSTDYLVLRGENGDEVVSMPQQVGEFTDLNLSWATDVLGGSGDSPFNKKYLFAQIADTLVRYDLDEREWAGVAGSGGVVQDFVATPGLLCYTTADSLVKVHQETLETISTTPLSDGVTTSFNESGKRIAYDDINGAIWLPAIVDDSGPAYEWGVARIGIVDLEVEIFDLNTTRAPQWIAADGGFVFVATRSALSGDLFKLNPGDGTYTTLAGRCNRGIFPDVVNNLVAAFDFEDGANGPMGTTARKITFSDMQVASTNFLSGLAFEHVSVGRDTALLWVGYRDNGFKYGKFLPVANVAVDEQADEYAVNYFNVVTRGFVDSGTGVTVSDSASETVTVGEFAPQPFATSRFTEAIRYSHRAITRAELITPLGDRFMLPVVDGTLTIDRRNQVWRTADLTVGLDAVGTIERAAIERLNVVGSDIALYAGIFYENDNTELVQIARLRVETFERRLSAASIQIAARDYASMLEEYPITPDYNTKLRGQDLVSAVSLLVNDALPYVMPGMATRLTVGDGLPAWQVPTDATFDGDGRLDTIIRWCEAAGVYFFNLPNGTFYLRAKNDLDATVLTVSDGDGGVLIDANEAFSRLELYNAVEVTFDAPEGVTTPVRAFVVDDDPASPTYWDGPFGKRVKQVSNVPAKTNAEASAAAIAKLNEAKGISRGLRVTGLRYPTLIPGDTIVVELPNEASEQHVVEAVTHNLSGATVEIETRFVT